MGIWNLLHLIVIVFFLLFMLMTDLRLNRINRNIQKLVDLTEEMLEEKEKGHGN